MMEFTIGKGQVKTLNWKHEFTKNIKVILWDLDNPPQNPDDQLGEITIQPKVVKNEKVLWGLDPTSITGAICRIVHEPENLLREGGWHTYILTYDVTRSN
jgi:hypothetical protein